MRSVTEGVNKIVSVYLKEHTWKRFTDWSGRKYLLYTNVIPVTPLCNE